MTELNVTMSGWEVDNPVIASSAPMAIDSYLPTCITSTS